MIGWGEMVLMEKINKELEHIKQDENGEEIVFEMKHNMSILDTFYQYFLFVFGSLILICLFVKLSDNIGIGTICIFFPIIVISFWGFRNLFYHHKNRIYITNQGIGFERKNWFRMQKKFFRFGEVGLIVFLVGLTETRAETFIFYPLKFGKPRIGLLSFLSKEYGRVVIEGDIHKEFFTFIRQKTKEALMANGIEINDEELKEKIQHLTFKDL